MDTRGISPIKWMLDKMHNDRPKDSNRITEKDYWEVRSNSSLEFDLQEAILDERFEDAANIRDEMKRRNYEPQTPDQSS